MLIVVMLNVIMLNIIMLNVIMLNVIMLNAIMLNVIMLSAVALLMLVRLPPLQILNVLFCYIGASISKTKKKFYRIGPWSDTDDEGEQHQTVGLRRRPRDRPGGSFGKLYFCFSNNPGE
jgi:hypothetical protein